MTLDLKSFMRQSPAEIRRALTITGNEEVNETIIAAVIELRQLKNDQLPSERAAERIFEALCRDSHVTLTVSPKVASDMVKAWAAIIDEEAARKVGGK